MIKENDIKYLVIINDEKFEVNETALYHCYRQFTAYLINTNCNQTIFELAKPKRAIVIVPTEKIKWMMPIKEKKEEKNE